MGSSAAAEIVSLVLLAATLSFAIVRPRGLPEAVAAAPAAMIALAVGAVGLDGARAVVAELAPTVVCLVAILVLADLCDREGMFTALGGLMARASHGRPTRLLAVVFAAAGVVTAVLTLDATVVLLTPAVLATAGRLGVRAKPTSTPAPTWRTRPRCCCPCPI